MTVYFDSSALVKLLLREQGCDLVEELWNRARLRVVSRVAYPETCAGLAAAKRAARIDDSHWAAALDDLDEVHEIVHSIGIDPALAVEAGDLAAEYSLRGYDAVHLASALSIDAPRVVVATWDRALSAAAGACGCVVIPAHP